MNTGLKAQCHWGGGSYGSPTDQKRCTNARHPKRQLCDKHEKLWRPIAKSRRVERELAEAAALAAVIAETPEQTAAALTAEAAVAEEFTVVGTDA